MKKEEQSLKSGVSRSLALLFPMSCDLCIPRGEQVLPRKALGEAGIVPGSREGFESEHGAPHSMSQPWLQG